MRSQRLFHLLSLGGLLFINSPSLQACTACFGQSDSRMAQGMNMGIAVLLAVIMTVLCGVVGFFYYLAKRNADMEEQQLSHYSNSTNNA